MLEQALALEQLDKSPFSPRYDPDFRNLWWSLGLAALIFVFMLLCVRREVHSRRRHENQIGRAKRLVGKRVKPGDSLAGELIAERREHPRHEQGHRSGNRSLQKD